MNYTPASISSIEKWPRLYNKCACGRTKFKRSAFCSQCRKAERRSVMQPSDRNIRHIPLTKGQVAIVDAADYEWLNQWRWWASWNRSTRTFYAARNEICRGKKRYVAMHRMILGLTPEDERDGEHIKPACTLDNRRSNLRIASRTQNVANQRRRITNTSGFKGVCPTSDGKRWRAQIRVNGEKRYLGAFDSPAAAYAAYCESARMAHGEFANFGGETTHS